MKTMPRWYYFYMMGNNCRVQGIILLDAEVVIDKTPSAVHPEDHDDFWRGYFCGRDPKVVSLPLLST